MEVTLQAKVNLVSILSQNAKTEYTPKPNVALNQLII